MGYSGWDAGSEHRRVKPRGGFETSKELQDRTKRGVWKLKSNQLSTQLRSRLQQLEAAKNRKLYRQLIGFYLLALCIVLALT
ncbi:MAG: hypothetical protein AAFP02_15495, partial [Bacteroidota bacterium]